MASLASAKSAPGGTGRMRARGGNARGDPLVPRLLLGRLLRDLRESRGMSRADAGRAVRGSPSKIMRIETGRIGPRLRDVTGLLAAYGIRDESEYSTLMALAEQTHARPWWYDYRDVVPDRTGAYLSAEQSAKLVRRFEVAHIPELLRTEAYARELIRRERPGIDDIDRHLELLAQRQRVLRRRPRPVNLWVVLDEAALRTPVGDVVTTRTQLHHLVTMSWRPNVTVQIASSRVCARVAGSIPRTLVRFPQPQLTDMVYLDGRQDGGGSGGDSSGGGTYPTRRSEIEHHWHIFNTLVTEAAPPEETPFIIEAVLAGC